MQKTKEQNVKQIQSRIGSESCHHFLFFFFFTCVFSPFLFQVSFFYFLSVLCSWNPVPKRKFSGIRYICQTKWIWRVFFPPPLPLVKAQHVGQKGLGREKSFACSKDPENKIMVTFYPHIPPSLLFLSYQPRLLYKETKKTEKKSFLKSLLHCPFPTKQSFQLLNIRKWQNMSSKSLFTCFKHVFFLLLLKFIFLKRYLFLQKQLHTT